MFLVVTTPFRGEGAPACLKFLKDKSFTCVWIFVRCPFWICKHRETSWFYFISFHLQIFALNWIWLHLPVCLLLPWWLLLSERGCYNSASNVSTSEVSQNRNYDCESPEMATAVRCDSFFCVAICHCIIGLKMPLCRLCWNKAGALWSRGRRLDSEELRSAGSCPLSGCNWRKRPWRALDEAGSSSLWLSLTTRYEPEA